MTKSGQLWGGRFAEKPHDTFAEFNDSFRFDRRLFAADVRASIAHANGLAGAGVLNAQGAAAPLANWLTDGGDAQRTGWQQEEHILTLANVKHMKLLWSYKTDNEPRKSARSPT